MAIVTKAVLKGYFETGDIPTQAQFEDLIDSLFAEVSGLLRQKYYVADVAINNPSTRAYAIAIAGGAGLASKYLTSDGLIKGAGNTFLFSGTPKGWGSSSVIAGVATAVICAGFDYSAVTGLARWFFVESATIILGGEGLANAANGTTVNCFAIGEDI